MRDVLMEVLPFFALIGLGWGAVVSGLFDAQSGRALTRFVFYFPLSALLFRLASGLDLAEIVDPRLIGGYLLATASVYAVAATVAWLRRRSLGEIAVESQCAVIGNVGFLGLPMLTQIFGAAAAGPLLQVLIVDLVVFSSLIVILFSVEREGKVGVAALRPALRALLENPMILAILAGLAVSLLGLPVPGPAARSLDILGAAATPGALFAIGVSLAGKSAERLNVAAWLSALKLLLHPAAAALAVLVLFDVPWEAARVVIAAAALPVAGNVFILAQSYGIAPARASTAILVSTIAAIATLTGALALLG